MRAVRFRWSLVTLAAWLIAVMCAIALPASAHMRSASYSSFTMTPSGATVLARLSALDESALAGAGLRPQDELPRALRLERGGQACLVATGSMSRVESADAFSTYRWELACVGPSEPARIVSDLLVAENPKHVHFAHVTMADGTSVEHVFDEVKRDAALPRAADVAPTVDVLAYVRTGVTHILTGWDHLAFLLVLLVVAARLREVAIVVTGFSLGHAATLCLTALGHVAPQAGPVEALIGLSVALVAFENLWLGDSKRPWGAAAIAVGAIAAAAIVAASTGRSGALAFAGVAWFAACYLPLVRRSQRPTRLRAMVAATFGLVHGFGFASSVGALAASGAPSIAALLGFNVGVELGQLAVVALAWPLLLVLRRRDEVIHRRAVQMSSAVALAWGVFWFAERAFGS